MAFIFFFFVKVRKFTPRFKIVPKIVKMFNVATGRIIVAQSWHVALNRPTSVRRYHRSEHLERKIRRKPSVKRCVNQIISQSHKRSWLETLHSTCDESINVRKINALTLSFKTVVIRLLWKGKNRFPKNRFVHQTTGAWYYLEEASFVCSIDCRYVIIKFRVN